MSAYTILGIPEGSSIETAKAAFRRLAMQHHPDREGGNPEAFKAIRRALDDIEAGKVSYSAPPPPPGPPPKSSFDDGYQSQFRQRKDAYKQRAGAKRPRDEMPTIQNRRHGTSTIYTCDIYLTAEQAFAGCFVPIRYNKEQIDFIVRPGTMAGTFTETVRTSNVIGAQAHHLTVQFNIHIDEAQQEPHEDKRDMELEVTISAISLIVGGSFYITDAKGEKVQVTIPVGYDPSIKLRVVGHGYGPTGGRGDLLLYMKPLWKRPEMFTDAERQLAAKLNTLVNPK